MTTLHEAVFTHASRDPDAPAVDAVECRLSYGSLASRVRSLARGILADGATPGERILVALPPGPAAVVASLAIQAAGGCAVEVDRGAGAPALRAMLAQATSRRAFVADTDAAVWRDVVGDRPVETAWVLASGPVPALPARDTVPLRLDGSVDREQVAAPPLPPPVSLDAPALVLFTSGSMGRPRGVVHTFRNIAANSRSIIAFLELTRRDRAMAILPFHYTYGRSVLQTHLFVGGSVFVDRRFSYPRVVLDALERERCTGFPGVPLTFELLRRDVDVATIPRSTLRYVTQAGGAMRPDTTRWVRRSFAPARLFVMYGQTEATARLSYVPPDAGDAKTGSIGIAIPGVELRVVDDAGRELGTGEAGHLIARGENVMAGYLDAPAETALVIREGWLWTGDLARRDADGFFWLAGRSSAVLKVRGYRVDPAEIEEVLLGHPAVRDAAVVGIPDPLEGDIPVAYVVGSQASERELRRFCRERLPVHKVPGRVRFVDAIPRSASGKPLRAELAADARALTLDPGAAP